LNLKEPCLSDNRCDYYHHIRGW